MRSIRWGKKAKLSAPPQATQRFIYGLEGPEGLRCHMNLARPLAEAMMNDGKAIRIQGIRVLWNKAPYNNRNIFGCYRSSLQTAVIKGELLRSPYMRGDYYVVPPNGARIHTLL